MSVQTEMLCRFLEKERAVVRRVDTNVEAIRRFSRSGIGCCPVRRCWPCCGASCVPPRSDVIHVQAASYWAFYLPVTLSLVFGRLCGVGSWCRSSAAWQPSSWRAISAGPGRCCAASMALPSPRSSCRRYFSATGFEALVIPSVIEIERFPFRPRATSGPPLVLWLRSLMAHANPAMALRAFALLRQSLPDARLMMIGRGPLAKEVGALARELGVADAIAYRPWLPFAQLRQAMQTASVLWNTNTFDNFPLSVLEAAALAP